MKILVTGCAGFIGSHVCDRLVYKGYKVVGIDNLNKYYDQNLKKDRLKKTFNFAKKNRGSFKFYKCDISNIKTTKNIFKKHKFDKVIHLAAQAGIRYSIENPHAYFNSNLLGFGNIIEQAKNFKVRHFVYASSSSVYGLSSSTPYSEETSDSDRPIQVYAATKRSNEIIAHAYSHLFKLKTTGLRLFTVYGPWGRPDMALFKFTKNILEEKKIQVFNYGENIRDFTYIDDIVDGILKASNRNRKKNKNDFVILNIGNGKPIRLINYITLIEKKLNKKAKKIFMKKQPGEMNITFSNNFRAKNLINYKANTKVEYGVEKFIDWYLKYYNYKI